MKSGNYFGIGLLASTALFAWPQLAAAQTAVEPGQSESEIEDIIVTANRTESLASRTPLALSVVTADDLRDQGISDATRLVDAVPNLAIDRVQGNGLQITIRGVTSTDVSEKGDPSAAFLSDGVYIARPQAQEVSLFDLQRVEVLRGPQGTLYGRNTTAGLINAISARPDDEFAASLDVVYGDFQTIQSTAMVNIPIDENVAVRAALNYNSRDSYILQGASAPTLDPGKDDLSFRLGALFDFDNVRLYLRGDYSEMQGNPTQGVALSNFFQMPIVAPAAGQRGAAPVYRSDRDSEEYRDLGFTQASEATSDNNTWGLLGELEVDLTDNLTATYLGAYREFTRDEVQRSYVGLTYLTPPPPPPGLRIPLNATFEGDYQQVSQELRLAFDGDRFDAQSGVYYFREESDVAFLLFGTQGFQPGQRGYVYGFLQGPTVSESIGYFGQVTAHLSEALRLTAGLRYTSDDKSRVGATIFHANITDPIDFTNATQPGTTNPRNVRDSLNNADVNYEETTWRLGFDYDLTPDAMLYGSVSTGYKAGGFNEGCLAGATNCNAPVPESALFYEPENLTAYELGVKTNLSASARLSAAYFHYDYENLQLNQISATYCGGPCLVISNAGEAEIDGVEVEGVFQPNEQNRLDFSVAWLDARYTDYQIAPGVNFAGEALDRSPELTASVGYEFTQPIGDGEIVLGLRSRYNAGYHLINTSLRNFFEQPSFTKTDFTVTYNSPGDRFYVQGFVKNIEDEITLNSVSLSANFPAFTDGLAFFGDPRTYGVRTGVRF